MYIRMCAVAFVDGKYPRKMEVIKIRVLFGFDGTSVNGGRGFRWGSELPIIQFTLDKCLSSIISEIFNSVEGCLYL